MSVRIAIWDAPIRLFHWALAMLVTFSYVTAKVGGGWMEWHVRSGYCVLTLLIFRLAWGIAGGETARFAGFVRGPQAALDYARALRTRRPPPIRGHNPLGGWMVVAILAILLLQATSGLFADDEIATRGPLADKVSNWVVSRMSTIHEINQWVVVGVVALHVVAIFTYQWVLGMNLIGPMVHGKAVFETPASAPLGGSSGLAVVVLAAAAAIVYLLVAIYPARP